MDFVLDHNADRYWVDDPDVWQKAAEMCAADVCFWVVECDRLSLALNTNDIFCPGADAEDVEPAEVAELFQAWKADGYEALWLSAGKKNGLIRRALRTRN